MNIAIKKIKYQNISSDHGRKLRLEEMPGIYAWYRDFDLRKYSNDKDVFLREIDKLLDVNLSDTFHSKIGYLYDVKLTEKSGSLPQKKKEWLQTICANELGRQVIVDALLTISEIQSPLYIGKAINIRNRIGEHVTGQSGLVDRLHNANIEIEKCFIKVIYMESEDIDYASQLISNNGSDSLVLLIEDLITRLGPSAFVRKPG